ncbi:MAG: HAD-IIA family hydrolase [Fimbriimonadaceae bacterium]|nr:HAD-IIA family hydrolase [Fimbriimonadaceae bacterium]
MKDYRLYLLDLDGTLYRGNEAVPHALDVVRELRARNKLLRFVTNNSGLTRQELVAKLNSIGFEARLDEVYGTSWAAAEWCKSNSVQTVFVIGEEGLKSSLREASVEVIDQDRPSADVVIAGICRTFDYKLCDLALQHLLAGAKFVATNRDATYPLERGRLQPGAGMIVAALEASSGIHPTVLGKPEPYLFELVMAQARVGPSETLVVGDRLNSDIEGGQRAGCDTLLVLTGVTKKPPSETETPYRWQPGGEPSTYRWRLAGTAHREPESIEEDPYRWQPAGEPIEEALQGDAGGTPAVRPEVLWAEDLRALLN